MYFIEKEDKYIEKENKLDKYVLQVQERTKKRIKNRLNRSVNKYFFPKFTPGDILVITFWKANIIYRFEGICISLKKKGLIKPDVSMILRNVLLGVGVEFIVSYFFNRVYNGSFSDYKRKRFLYLRSKLYYLRAKINRQSKVN